MIILFLRTFPVVLVFLFLVHDAQGIEKNSDDQQLIYTGSFKCKQCHPQEYAAFLANAKKSSSYQSIEKMRKGLSSDDLKKCYSCHTTGYGKPGGFIDPETTPHLKNAGCEVCHGPGSLHCQTTDPADIKGELSTDDCKACHTSERVKAFRYRPLVHGGGH
ncbi:MAG: cytochrome c family protein [Desulfobulbaceae bacterium]|nr:cytochrome c family protein [Desulfobulbaceae bacterium]